MPTIFLDRNLPFTCSYDKISQYLSTDKFVYIFYDPDEDTDCEGHTYKEGEAIYIWIHKDNPLVLAHELIHAKQLIQNRKLNEKEAYDNEEELCSRLFNRTADESSL